MRIPGRDKIASTLDEMISAWRNGNSAVAFINGESGVGKSFVLDAIMTSISSNADARNVGADARNVVRVDCRPPIGTFNVAAIQPLQPFGHAIEQLYLNGEQTAKKRLAMNIGMSVLASIPIAGDIFYAVKAISQDLSEYKKETSAIQQKKRAAVDECVLTLERIARESPIALLIDDAQWSDGQSVEVVKRILHWQAGIPLLLVWASTPSLVKKHNVALATLLREQTTQSHIVQLESLELENSKAVIQAHAPTFKPTDKQVTLLHERSAGNPGILIEYVRYLERSKQVDKDGHFADTALTESGMSLGDHPATDVVLHEIVEQDAMTLALCATEGREFTAFMLAALMNVDVLTAVRTLRRLQQSTATIKSLGMRTRYGIKTTTYEFTTAIAYTYFQHYPEYEERKFIHQRIVEILSKERAAAEIDEIRVQLNAFIAAHSTEAEDAETAQRSLAESGITQQEQFELPLVAGSSSIASALTTPADAIDTACDFILHCEPSKARKTATDALSLTGCTTRERTLLRCLAARADIDMGRITDAEAMLDKAESDPNMSDDDRCLVINTRVIAALMDGDTDKARVLLADAAQLTSSELSVSKMLTISNMFVVLRETSDAESNQYMELVNRLTRLHSWSALRADLSLN